MRYLFYTNYQSGHSGLSNAIMSIEVGVVLAFLTNRMLLLDGNLSPPANIVSYGDRINNDQRSRVTDLIDLPVAWNEPEEVDLNDLHARELTDQHLMNSMFYLPDTVDIESEDAAYFANGRNHWLCESDQIAPIPLLKVSEDPIVLSEARKRSNLCFYSYFFYLDNETRRAVYQLLQRMQAKPPYAELARRVAQDLGAFNAVHMRRGDFKVTYGVTVLDRQPWEAIEALDNHFERDQRLLIVTDERDDPFFDEIKTAYPDYVFIDHHILDHYADDFFALPQHDSIALAYLSQLVAAESQDFIGTMTSTFTSIIQRYRGNRGKPEPFKFLWNELPDPGERVERGSHPVSDCIPLDNGIMIEESSGPYSWNRYNSLLNPAWMREWPESFVTEQALNTGVLPGYRSSDIGLQTMSQESAAQLLFEGVRIVIRSEVPGLTLRLKEMFANAATRTDSGVTTELSINAEEGVFHLQRGEQRLAEADSEARIIDALIRFLVPQLIIARKHHIWFNGQAFKQGGRTIVYTGATTINGETIADTLCSAGWQLLGDQVIPVKVNQRQVLPFVRRSWPKGASARLQFRENELAAIVYGHHQLHNQDSVSWMSPSLAVARLLSQTVDFYHERDLAAKRLATLMEQVPAYQLSFSQLAKTPIVLGFLAQDDLPNLQELNHEPI